MNKPSKKAKVCILCTDKGSIAHIEPLEYKLKYFLCSKLSSLLNATQMETLLIQYYYYLNDSSIYELIPSILFDHISNHIQPFCKYNEVRKEEFHQLKELELEFTDKQCSLCESKYDLPIFKAFEKASWMDDLKESNRKTLFLTFFTYIKYDQGFKVPSDQKIRNHIWNHYSKHINPIRDHLEIDSVEEDDPYKNFIPKDAEKMREAEKFSRCIERFYIWQDETPLPRSKWNGHFVEDPSKPLNLWLDFNNESKAQETMNILLPWLKQCPIEMKVWNGYWVPKGAQADNLDLQKKHGHYLDKEIIFWEMPHKYLLKGYMLSVSCTGLIHRYFPHFEFENAIKSMINGKSFPFGPKHPKYYGLPIWQLNNGIRGPPIFLDRWIPGARARDYINIADTIFAYWDALSYDASTRGTELHLHCEYYCNGVEVSNHSKEYTFFLKFMKWMKQRGFIPYRTEMNVFLIYILLAGQADILFVKQGTELSNEPELYLYDWKRTKDILKINKYQKANPPIDDLQDTSLSHYMIQLPMYKYMFENTFNYKIKGMFIVVMHPDNQATYSSYKQHPDLEQYGMISEPYYDDFIVIEIPDRQNHIRQIFEERRAELEQQMILKKQIYKYPGLDIFGL
jgi:hypothetical protein